MPLRRRAPRPAPLAAMLALAAAFAGGSAGAIEDAAAFNVSFGGIRAGVIALRAEQSGGQYTAHGSARPSGLLAALFEAEIDTVASGAVSGNTYRPRMAKEVTAKTDERTERSFRYAADGVPSVTRTPPRGPSAHAAPPDAQAGTVDTTTAAYAILRDRRPELACQLDIAVYDGRRRHRIELTTPRPTEDGLRCTGRYTRVAGFSPEDMAGQTVWPLTLDYTRRPGGALRVDRLSFPTSFGRARITRR